MELRGWHPRELVRGGIVVSLFVALAVAGFADSSSRRSDARSRNWLAGDHHIHSEFSVGLDDHDNDPATPPIPIIAGDAIYPVAINAIHAQFYGLDWMVQTDHGDPHHSKVNRELAYPALLLSRKEVPRVLQFYGMELDTPGADHSTVMIPKSRQEEESLFQIESRYSKNEPWPPDPNRNTEPKMLETLTFMRSLGLPPLVFANHASRSAPCPGPPAPQPCPAGVWGQDTPQEFRNWNDTAPEVAVGFEGAPGHQATSIGLDGTASRNGARGSFGGYPTHGGFDQMTAIVGGLWDSLLGEGRRWWITSTSDSHVNWRDGGGDFWPGEYSKTYVKAHKTYASVLDGLRNGRVFVTLGDLITSLDVTAHAHNHGDRFDQQPWRDDHGNGDGADIGETLRVRGHRDVTITIRLRDPFGANSHGDAPSVRRVDLIVGKVTGPVLDRTTASNPTTTVVRRFGPEDWHQQGEHLTMRYTLTNVTSDSYVRVRGTNTEQLEPERDPRGEDPWNDLWFYSNPIFIDVRGKH
jgi:hypothetical protein